MSSIWEFNNLFDFKTFQKHRRGGKKRGDYFCFGEECSIARDCASDDKSASLKRLSYCDNVTVIVAFPSKSL